MNFSEFTNDQKALYTKIHDLEHELMASIDPTTFVLNPKTLVLRYEIEKLQRSCSHVFENGECVICGKVENE